MPQSITTLLTIHDVNSIENSDKQPHERLESYIGIVRARCGLDKDSTAAQAQEAAPSLSEIVGRLYELGIGRYRTIAL